MFIDIHTHATPYRTVPLRRGSYLATPDELLTVMDQASIDMAVVLPHVSPDGRTVVVPTEQGLEICRRHPDRLIPFCNIDPRQEGNSPDTDFSRHFQAYKELGCKGLGEVTVNLYFDDPLVQNLFRQCEEAELPLILHIAPQVGGYYGLVDDLHLPRLEETLKRFPKLPVIGHSQPFWSEIGADVTAETRNRYPQGPAVPGRVPELFDKYPNLYGDISAHSGLNAFTRDPEFGYRFLEEHQDRLLFGTDTMSLRPEPPQVEYLKSAVQQGKISRAAFEKVAWRNADRLLGLGIG